MNKCGRSPRHTQSMSFRSLSLCMVLMSTIALSGCSSLVGSAVSSLLSGGGPSASANVQAGKTNTQTLGTNQVDNRKIEISGEKPQPRITQDTNTTNNISNQTWLIIAFALALVLDSPLRWPGQIWRAFNGQRK